jgi:LPXTG-motif cell wall-anchored protein
MTNTGGVRLGRLVVMLVALAMWAVPATALAQDTSDDDVNDSNDPSNSASQNQSGSATGGDADGSGGGQGGGGGTDGGGGSGGDDNDGVGGTGGDANLNQNQTIQQCNVVAGDDGVCDQRNVTNQNINAGGAAGVGAARGRVAVVRGVRLARTGFDAWMFALLGGASLAGGLTLLARQRRTN